MMIVKMKLGGTAEEFILLSYRNDGTGFFVGNGSGTMAVSGRSKLCYAYRKFRKTDACEGRAEKRYENGTEDPL